MVVKDNSTGVSENLKYKPTKLEDLNPGNLFEFKNDIFLLTKRICVIDDICNLRGYLCVDIFTGDIYIFLPKQLVTPVDGHMVIE